MAEESSGTREWLRDIDTKVDRLLDGLARLETSQQHNTERMNQICERLGAGEARITHLEGENKTHKGEINMLRWIGGAIAVAVTVVATVLGPYVSELLGK